MAKIIIENNQFICPMMETIISERGKLNYGYCRKCKYNILGQFVDNNVYCRFKDSEQESSGNIFDPENYWEEYQG